MVDKRKAKRISQSAYARRAKVSRQAVSKAIKAGRITRYGSKIDPDLADAEWLARTPKGYSYPLVDREGTSEEFFQGCRLPRPFASGCVCGESWERDTTRQNATGGQIRTAENSPPPVRRCPVLAALEEGRSRPFPSVPVHKGTLGDAQGQERRFRNPPERDRKGHSGTERTRQGRKGIARLPPG